jgi:hypothetical protein
MLIQLHVSGTWQDPIGVISPAEKGGKKGIIIYSAEREKEKERRDLNDRQITICSGDPDVFIHDDDDDERG